MKSEIPPYAPNPPVVGPNRQSKSKSWMRTLPVAAIGIVIGAVLTFTIFLMSGRGAGNTVEAAPETSNATASPAEATSTFQYPSEAIEALKQGREPEDEETYKKLVAIICLASAKGYSSESIAKDIGEDLPLFTAKDGEDLVFYAEEVICPQNSELIQEILQN